jgi:hypothetical protein
MTAKTKLKTDLIHLELLYFFRNNPSIMDTIGGIASRIGRSSADIDDAVSYFVKLNVLKEQNVSGMKIYIYDREVDRKLQKKRVLHMAKEQIVETAEGIVDAKKGKK